PDKRLTRVTATHAQSGAPMEGYEIHIGRSDGPARARPFAHIDGQPEGATTPDGRIMGSYLHGMFSGDAFRAAFLAQLGAPASANYGATVEATLDALADHMEAHLDVPGLLALAR
ncbi:MAG: cobyric acid synthase CobQ, partial [Albidovulum sp.]